MIASAPKGVRERAWWDRLQEVIAFRNEFGHLPSMDENKTLFRWVRKQRTRLYKISQEQRDAFLNYGLCRTTFDDIWDRNLDRVLKFQAEYGRALTAQDDKALYVWLHRQARNPALRPEREQMLRDSGVLLVDKVPSESWLTKYNEVLEYRALHGRLPGGDAPNLRDWLSRQRREGCGEVERSLLEKEGLLVAAYQTKWMERFQEVLAYRDQHGHLPTASDALSLYRWLYRQTHRELEPAQKQLLEDNGLFYNALDEIWFQTLNRVVSFFELHERLPGPTDDLPLSKWISRQKSSFLSLSEQKQKALLDADILTSNSERDWYQSFHELMVFFNQHGLWPGYSDNRKLYFWRANQMRNYHDLPYKQQVLLNDVNVFTSNKDIVWEQHLQELLRFKVEHGRLPSKKDDLQLYAWFYRQNPNRISRTRKNRLIEVGLLHEPTTQSASIGA